ncbi:MAG: beta-L-arabinofuranosidase domain-containing protein [Hominenteromicrobium sp.]
MGAWEFYTTNEIRPRGWLRRQLELQAAGLSGNLDRVWPDVRDSAWIGGNAEGWERVPYWLDGFIPLAYLLEDDDMIARAKKYIDAILAAQKSDGWICPCADADRKTYDTWALLLLSKVLTVYYACSKDDRIPGVLYDTLKNYCMLLKSGEIRLFNWGRFRWYEGFIAIRFLYDRYREDWLTELAGILKAQGTDYPALMPLWEEPKDVWRFDTHIVNIAMALKYEAVSCELLGEAYRDDAETLYAALSRHNGTPVGLFTGDECLSGLSPIQGTELCAVVEQMYSCELLYAHTGDPKWAERLEMLAFNALPATLSDDMWAHQYVQMSNQMACRRFPEGVKPIFRTNGPESHLFGLEPNFGCCTANFSQGWPKFALSAFLHSGSRVLSAVPVPAVLETGDFRIELETEYPFENTFRYTVSSKTDFTFQIRIPSFAQAVLADGKPFAGEMFSVEIRAGETREIRLQFETAPHFVERPYDLTSVQCGSLVFSVPVRYEKKRYEYEKNGAERRYPYCDYEYLPVSGWNYAYCGGALTLRRRKTDAVPFSSENPPVTVAARTVQIDWGMEPGYDALCAKVPRSRVPLGAARETELYPYGCAKLRMTELPLINE